MKSDKATVRKRVEDILRLKLRSADFTTIVQYAASEGWGVKERQLRNYIAAADELLSASLERDRAKLLDLHLAQRRLLLSYAIAASDFTNARLLLKDDAELRDLYPPKRNEVTGKDGQPLAGHLDVSNDPLSEWSDEELNALRRFLTQSGQVSRPEGGPVSDRADHGQPAHG